MTTRKYDIVSEVRRAVSLLLNIKDMSDNICLDEVKKCLVDATVNISELRVLPDRYVELVRESVTGIVTEQLKAILRHNLIVANRCKKEIAYIERSKNLSFPKPTWQTSYLAMLLVPGKKRIWHTE